MTAIDNYFQLTMSPLVLHGLLDSFYRNLTKQPNNLLLAYLVLPIVTHIDSRKYLLRVTAASNLRTFCKEKERIFGLEKRIDDFKSVTTRCIQVMIDLNLVQIDSDLSILRLTEQSPSHLDPSLLKCARNLAKIMDSHSVVSTFTYLGIREL